jgi:hypothetical protein
VILEGRKSNAIITLGAVAGGGVATAALLMRLDGLIGSIRGSLYMIVGVYGLVQGDEVKSLSCYRVNEYSNAGRGVVISRII